MATLSKWLIGIALVIMLLGGGLYGLVSYYVGAVNLAVPNDDLRASEVVAGLEVPAGFSIGIYADNVRNARLLRFSRTGDLLVSTPNLDKVEILGRDLNGDGQADGQRTLIANLNGPNGLDFYQDWLYIAETDAIGRIKFNHQSGYTEGAYERLVTGLPGGGNHWKKTLRFGPDALLYVTMGSSCNVCEEHDARRGSMVRYQPDGSGEVIFAQGLRNSAGFDWSPLDGQIYATDNGRDMLGDEFPPCELNLLQAGAHYGWPFANGHNVPDPDFGTKNPRIVATSLAPVFDFKPHNAPLGIEFVPASSFFPERFQNSAIVALHGSWNRSQKDGYKVVSLHWDASGRITSKDLVSGFLQGDAVSGRPAEVTAGPDGAFYISDDFAQVIYRLAYKEE